MNWSALIVAFAVAVVMGAFLANLLERRRLDWSARRRLWTAAAVLPGFILAATLVGIAIILFTGPGSGENMRDLAVAATAAVGGIFALIALVGGLVGASFARRRQP